MDSSSNTGAIEVQGQTPEEGSKSQDHPTPTEPIQIAETTEPKSVTEIFEAMAEDSTGEQTQGHRRRGLLIGGGAVAAAVGLLVGGIFVGTQLGRHGDAAPDPNAKDRQNSADKTVVTSAPSSTPQASAKASALPSPTQSETVGANGEVIVPTISASQSPEAIGNQVLQEALIDWRNGGVTSNVVTDQTKSGLPPAAFAANNADKQATAYESALFIDGWQNRSDVFEYAQQVHAQNLENAVLSIDTTKDQYPFHWGIDTEKINVTTATSNEVDLSITFREFQNATQNSAAGFDPSLANDVSHNARMDVRLLKFGDIMKISAISKIVVP